RRGGDLRSHKHWNALRVYPRLHRRHRTPLYGSQSCASIPRAVRSRGRFARRVALRVSHGQFAQAGLGSFPLVASHRPGVLFQLWFASQPIEEGGLVAGPSALGPSDDRDADGSQPLQGVRVLDLTRLLPGSYATLMLADLGADVIKIEDPRGGDHARQMPPLAGGTSVFFHLLNRNKRSVTLDFRSPEAAAVLDALAARSDVLVDSFRPRTAKRLG